MAALTVYLPNGSISVGGVLVVEYNDATRQFTRRTTGGTVTEGPRAYTPEEDAAADAAAAQATATTNETTIRDKARTALASNAAFLALASPTNAQTLTQVRALTRQVNALVKLQLNDLATLDGV